MIVDSIMSRRVVTIGAEETVRAAAGLMKARSIGGLVVVRRGAPVGMLTERDVVHRVVAAGRDPDRTPVSSVMSSPLATTTPDVAVDEAAAEMKRLGVKRLVVVLDGTLRGIVTVTDVAHARPELSREFMRTWVDRRWDD